MNFATAAPRFGLRLAHVLRMRLSGSSDYNRWTDIDNHETWWAPRTHQLAKLVPPGSAVIEFGAGRRHLEKCLSGAVRYVPSDLVDRGSGTLICDLNKRPLPDLSFLQVDTAVFSGVLEYVVDVPAVAEWLAPQVTRIIASYAYVPDGGWSVGQARERTMRLKNGYMNQYTRAELVAVMEAKGFRRVASDSWESQELFLFERTARGEA